MAMRDYFLSNECWLKHVKSFLLSHKQFFVGGASAKVASSTKVKGIKHRAMWGDPPKPNLWKVVSSWYAGGGEQFSYCSVESPILKEGSFFQLMFDTSSKLWEIRYSGSTSFSVHTFYNVKTFLEARKIFLSRKGWKIIKTFASIAGTDFFRTKVASSTKPQSMWGNPPKPNLWKVEEYPNFAYGAFVEVTSPLLGGPHRSFKLTSPEYNKSGYYQIEYSNSNDPEWYQGGYNGIVYQILHTKSYTEALEYFLSRGGWGVIVRWASQQEFPIFKKNKVASSTKLQAQWGNPPKPNLWKVEEYEEFVEVSSPLLGDSTISLTSPAYNGTYHYQVEFNNSHTSKIIMVVYSYPYENALKWFLGSTFWNWDFLKWVGEQSFPVFTTNKVASSV